MVRVGASGLSIEAGGVGRVRSVRQWLACLQVRAGSAEQSHRSNAVGLVAVASRGADCASHAGAVGLKAKVVGINAESTAHRRGGAGQPGEANARQESFVLRRL